ncbi:hypothetical protein SDC9_181961 [bioreactor metagenome]|uniref:Uncharacterized protein n=1 Tax=bioreactor metagenome TaxID=1076179 RepID=A0A645H623_9ZZZZ
MVEHVASLENLLSGVGLGLLQALPVDRLEFVLARFTAGRLFTLAHGVEHAAGGDNAHAARHLQKGQCRQVDRLDVVAQPDAQGGGLVGRVQAGRMHSRTEKIGLEQADLQPARRPLERREQVGGRRQRARTRLRTLAELHQQGRVTHAAADHVVD